MTHITPPTATLHYLTYTIDLPRIERYIFPALDTWHPRDQPYYVTMSRDYESAYQEKVRTNETWRQYSSPRIEMLFVDDCEDGSYLSACCKQEKGMVAYMKKQHEESKRTNSITSTVSAGAAWLVVADDDNYFQHDFLANALEHRVSSKPEDLREDLHEDLLVITNGMHLLLGKSGYPGLQQESTYNCSYAYRWGQVSIYNRATLQKIQRGLEMGGLLDICREYGVYQDVGNAIFHWMYSLPNLWVNISPYCFRPVRKHNRDNFGCHGVGKAGSDRFDLSMRGLQEFYSIGSSNESSSVTPNFLFRNNAYPKSGFHRTQTYQQYGDPSSWINEWHRFPVSDCEEKKTQQGGRG